MKCDNNNNNTQRYSSTMKCDNDDDNNGQGLLRADERDKDGLSQTVYSRLRSLPPFYSATIANWDKTVRYAKNCALVLQ